MESQYKLRIYNTAKQQARRKKKKEYENYNNKTELLLHKKLK